MCFYLSVLPSSKHNILLLKHWCAEFISIKLPTMGKSNQKTGKTHNYPCVQISYLTSHKGFGVRKKRVISYSKTTILMYFYKLKKKQQDQGGKYFYISIRSKLWSNNYSTISNLRETTYSNILVLVLFWKY